jgi:predicted metal-dependent phosphotriesterase family hydrolase
LREFIALLLDLGITDEQIEMMVQRNPAKLLGMNGDKL